MIIITSKLDVAKDILDFARCEYVELTPTTETPKQDGLYGAKHKEQTEEGWMWVYVDEKHVLHFDWEGLAEFSDFTEWIGPIPEPNL